VKPAAFAYAKARALDHAIELLGQHRDGAKLRASGQSLMATLNMRLSYPQLLIDIDGLGLDGVTLKIGALVRPAPPTRRARS
jgi:aerobic carbon-monoxide dehydrogenase medium subunit